VKQIAVKHLKKWPEALVDYNNFSAAEFYFTNQRYIESCALCGEEILYWQKADDAFNDHQRCGKS
jgi:hypothetical protein